MTFSEFGNSGPGVLGARTRPARSPRRAGYDSLAGAAVLRRTGKAAPGQTPLRGDSAETLLAARRKNDGDDKVGRQLRDFYQAVMREPVPERFVELISDLEAGRPR